MESNLTVARKQTWIAETLKERFLAVATDCCGLSIFRDVVSHPICESAACTHGQYGSTGKLHVTACGVNAVFAHPNPNPYGDRPPH